MTDGGPPRDKQGQTQADPGGSPSGALEVGGSEAHPEDEAERSRATERSGKAARDVPREEIEREEARQAPPNAVPAGELDTYE
jgi:hypothetical protein